MKAKQVDQLIVGDEIKLPGEKVFVKIERIDFQSDGVNIRYLKSGQSCNWKALTAFIPELFEVKESRGTVPEK